MRELWDLLFAMAVIIAVSVAATLGGIAGEEPPL
jgi:hypothetical protein